MARAIVVWCDMCMAQDPPQQSEAAPYAVTINGSQPREVDLCEVHFKELLLPIRTVLEEHGARPEAPQAPTKPRDLSQPHSDPRWLQQRAELGMRQGRAPANGARPVQCPLCNLNYAGDGSLYRHLEKVHGLPDSAKEWGRQCPLCGGEYDALGNHVSARHDMFVANAFRVAREQGDEFGAYAALAARAKHII